MSDKPDKKNCRLLFQQCKEATLRSDAPDFQPVEIRMGMVVYVCFLKNANESCLNKLVTAILNAKLVEHVHLPDPSSGENVLETSCPITSRRKIIDLEEKYDILLIPQATLGGTLKGDSVQYHGNTSKDLGKHLFSQLYRLLSEAYDLKQKIKDRKGVVLAGYYGARQILKLDTNGPYTHVFDL